MKTINGLIATTPLTDKTPTGRTRTIFIMAVEDEEGNYKPTPCIAHNEQAEALKDLTEGAEVTIEGDFHERFYEKDGQTSTITEINIENVLF